MRLPLICLTALLAFAPAHADKTEPVDLSLTFDTQLLRSAAGSEQVLTDIKRQVTEVCKYERVGGRHVYREVDASCAADLLEQVVHTIDASHLTKAYETTIGQRIAVAAD